MIKRPFVGHVISEKPVTIQESKKAGIIKPDPEPEKPKEKPKQKEDEQDGHDFKAITN